MIEVLRKGKKKTVECQECGALLRYTPDDVKMENPMQGIAGYVEYIECPECNTRVVIRASKNLRVAVPGCGELHEV